MTAAKGGSAKCGFPQVAGVVAIFVGGLVLAGWVFDISALQSVAPDFISMKANPALCFMLAGVALWLLQRDGLCRPKLGSKSAMSPKVCRALH